MIWESYYWKEELHRIVGRLKSRLEQLRWVDRSFAKTELDVMIGFYIVRKLVEAKKLTTNLVNSKIKVAEFRSRGASRVTLMNWHYLDKHFDLANSFAHPMQLIDLCNQIVHSYIFMLDFNEDEKISGVYFSSDYKRTTVLYRIDFDSLVAIFESIAFDFPNAGRFEYNREKGDYDIINYSNGAMDLDDEDSPKE